MPKKNQICFRAKRIHPRQFVIENQIPSTRTEVRDTTTYAPSPPLAAEGIQVGLLTGGQDGHYAYGLAMALAGEGVYLDFIGSDELDSPELHASPRLRFLNLQGGHGTDESLARKMLRVLLYYTRLVWYAALAKPKIFHVLWNNKFELFDRTLLMLYYKLLGKKIAFTAHNINIGKRDSADTLLK